MTHAESQDLLLDLAYGELDPAREQEVLGHLAGCDECQREKAALDEARRLTAPLRELEEPSHGFDDRILAAARTQAQMDHGGNIGQVIEVSGNVRPLGLEPARIDAHGPIAARQERRKPRWAVRVALGGSVAAAAALALVVSTTLQNKHAEEMARAAASDKSAFQIRVQPAPVAVAENEALREAQLKEAPRYEAVHTVQPPERLEKRAAAPAKKKDVAGGKLQGSGGDAFDSVGAASAPAGANQIGGVGQAGGGQMGAVGQQHQFLAPQQTPVATREEENKPQPAPAAAPEPVAEKPTPLPSVEAKPQAVVAAPPPPAEKKAAVKAEARSLAMATAAADDRTAAQFEAEAQSMRHAGKYALAASMYQKAAAIRREAGDQAESPAWDLTHAVECYAAVGQFDDAFRVRDQLQKLYPDEKTAISAANRVLRQVDATTPAAAAKGPSSQPKAEPDEMIPAQH